MQTQGWSERETAEASVGLLSCASCNGPVANGAAARCPECRALYHLPCWNELTGCVTPGCRGHRRMPTRGPLTLVSESVVDVETILLPPPQVETIRLPAPQVELLPPPERVESATAHRRRRDWISTVAVAVVALVAGIGATLALVHRGDTTQRNGGYSSGYNEGYRKGATGSFDSGFKKGNQAGWKAGYERGFLEGCHAAQGPDATCLSPIVPADGGDGGPTPTTGTPPATGSSPPVSSAQPVGNTSGGFVPRVT